MQKALITLKAKDNSHILYFEKVEETSFGKHKKRTCSLWINRENSEIVNFDLYSRLNNARCRDNIMVNFIEYDIAEIV